KPANVAVETVTTEKIPADPSLAAEAAAALAGTVSADPATGEQLAFAPPVLPSPLKVAPGEGSRSVDGTLKKSDRLLQPGPEAAPSPEAKDGEAAGADASVAAPANLPQPLPLPRPKPEIVLAAM